MCVVICVFDYFWVDCLVCLWVDWLIVFTCYLLGCVGVVGCYVVYWLWLFVVGCLLLCGFGFVLASVFGFWG